MAKKLGFQVKCFFWKQSYYFLSAEFQCKYYHSTSHNLNDWPTGFGAELSVCWDQKEKIHIPIKCWSGKDAINGTWLNSPLNMSHLNTNAKAHFEHSIKVTHNRKDDFDWRVTVVSLFRYYFKGQRKPKETIQCYFIVYSDYVRCMTLSYITSFNEWGTEKEKEKKRF